MAVDVNEAPSGTSVAKQQKSAKQPLIIGGVVVGLLGLVAAALLAWAAGQRNSNAVESLARGPVGCDTTLDFTATGEFFVFVESEGNFDNLAGDCDAEGAFAVSGSPDIELDIVSPAGNDVDIVDASGIDYDAAGFAGAAVGSIEVEQTGSYVLRASSPDGPFAIAIGRDPGDGVAALRNFAVAALLAGLLLGALLIALGFRRTARAEPAVAEEPGEWGGAWGADASGPPQMAPSPIDPNLPRPPAAAGVVGEALPATPPPFGAVPSPAPMSPPMSGESPFAPPSPVAQPAVVPGDWSQVPDAPVSPPPVVDTANDDDAAPPSPWAPPTA